MPLATTDAQRAVADAVRTWAAKCRPVATARAHEAAPEGWRRHWAELAGLGIFAVAVEADAGGTVADLAVMLEQAAAALVPGPVVSTALAGLLLARTDAVDAPELLERVADGRLPVAVGLGGTALTTALTATRNADGGLRVRGGLPVVLGADATTALLLPARCEDGEVWFVLDPDTAAVKVVDQPAADFSRALAEVHLDDVDVPAGRVLGGIDGALVDDLTATLFAAEAAGIADWCLHTAVDYALVREQFGKPIGSFQAIKHLCAEMLCRVEQATAVAWDAAQAAGERDEPDQFPLAAAVAAAVALDAAVETAKDCIQVLGGIGFTWEHDAHLYLRRAIALRQLLGGSARWRRRVAELTLAGSRRALHIDLADGPTTDGTDHGRAEVRRQAARIAALPGEQRRAALADAGYLAPHWPEPYGLAASAAEQIVIDQELTAAGIERPDIKIAAWAVPTIVQYGTQEQIERFAAPSLRGEVVWCQLFSEPGAGSDLASLRTKADRVEGGWRLTGQKVWTSLAHTADWAICLARTDADAPKHKGISYFLVDMKSPGLDIRPLREITGEAMFNEVFLDGVFVPDELVVGAVNDGWTLARATLVNERVAMSGGSSIGDGVEQLVASAAAAGLTGDPGVLDTLGGLVGEALSGSLLDVRSTLRQLDGRDAGAGSSVRKLVGVRHRQAVAETALDLLGPLGAVDSEQLHEFLMTRCLTIAGGTTQVLLTLAAERLLGLPRG